MTFFRPFAVFCGLFLATAGHAATFPTDFSETTLATSLAAPTAMAFAPNGRVFICEQGGRVRIVKNNQLLETPFLTITVDDSGERGLLGLAFHPNYRQNPWFYFYYTVPGENGNAPHNRVARVRASTANGDIADMTTQQTILDLPALSSATNHNGGALHFSAGNKLFVAVGENANSSNAQSLDTLLGKILRLNPDGTIPNNNPFYPQKTGKLRSIWALGLRNPYTFAFQPGTNRMFINDVGQSTWEEINEGRAGANFGWPRHEGPSNETGFAAPVYAYRHDSSDGGCAITGGTFYNPSQVQFPASYLGKYFFADFCSGWIHVLNPATGTFAPFADGLGFPIDLQTGPDGALYYLARGEGGVLRRVAYGAPIPPSITRQPQSVSTRVGQAATFSVEAYGTSILAYQWQGDSGSGFSDIFGATAATFRIDSPQLTASGRRFRVIVSNVQGSVTSEEATLTVSSAREQSGF